MIKAIMVGLMPPDWLAWAEAEEWDAVEGLRVFAPGTYPSCDFRNGNTKKR